MLNSTIELITLAASNSLLMFCFCNFIIAVLLVGGPKPALEYGQDSSIPPPSFAFRNTNEIGGTSSTTTCSVDNDNGSTGVSELCAVKASTVESVEVQDEEKENDDDGDDDELRRRVEEFIDNIRSMRVGRQKS